MTKIDSDLKIINESAYFDRTWYVSKYPDVGILEMDPAEHFLRFGALLKRSPGPNFNTRFYRSVYSDAHDQSMNPLLVHHNATCQKRRPTTLSEAKANAIEMEARTRDQFASPDMTDLKISYCIPIAGRLDDLKGTLRENLEGNHIYRKQVEFLIAELGAPGEVSNWLEENFQNELEIGYLRYVSDQNLLDGWHFGRAKNSFKPYIRGQVYSSLDGDNFVTAEETAKLLSVIDDHPFGFVMHHFSGSWGDGTSGRVSMPRWLYRAVGYDETLLPRQFDEMDLILGALSLCPAVPFVGVSQEKNVFTLSKNVANYFCEQRMPNRKIFVGDCKRRVPLNPRGEKYAEIEAHLQHMNNFNAALSALRRGSLPEMEARYVAEISKHKHRLIEALPADKVLPTIFESQNARPIFSATSKDICLVSCLNNEENFLRDFVVHYRNLGVTRFLFVDDFSEKPVSELGLGDDVYSYRPKVGDFRTSKTLWMECLLKAAGASGGWVVAADADEFLQLPNGYNSLTDVISELENGGLDFAPALLLDMVPDPDRPLKDFENSNIHYSELLDHFINMEGEPSEAYAAAQSIQWAFGPHARLSWRFDIRYHIFGTFDCLRKFPFFKYVPNRHLNQGFHTFHFEDGTPNISHKVWQNAPILPIYHYKLNKLFSDAAREQMLRKAKGYHARTSENIEHIFTSDSKNFLDLLSQVKHLLEPAHIAKENSKFSDEIYNSESI